MRRKVSRKTIRLLTAMLVQMAKLGVLNKQFPNKQFPREMNRFDVMRDYPFPALKNNAVITFFSEPDFALRFCRDTGQGTAYIVELYAYHDKVVQHVWSRYALVEMANALEPC